MSSVLSEKVGKILTDNLREIQDFPEPGVLFRDITPLLANGPAFCELIEQFADYYRGRIDAVAGLESRGFILAAPLATRLGIGMLTIRKAGKLPGPVIGVDYDLEYGSARMELRPDSVTPGHRVLILDDVLATGGTAAASAQLIREAGAEVVGITVLLELAGLGGRQRLEGENVESVVVL
ncbi:adenine phosphoribosyltransferase [Schaalia sp. lx-100]|uniref:adenine phosphoribosyltransferase n=1 Tax=Schaalia sp. lx-100 TaxID=2899081 RepID=UPI001E38997B|nr:adenine phosphoribosyltransferase [Schaalia sp. lx-100]MCD4557387.1 adenine phosphoribosyltransferase [Schaalia sp. lx-100]